MSRTVRATAIIEVTVKVQLSQPWGDDCKLDQVFKQAARDGVDEVKAALTARSSKMWVTGEPKVTAVLTEEKR